MFQLGRPRDGAATLSSSRVDASVSRLDPTDSSRQRGVQAGVGADVCRQRRRLPQWRRGQPVVSRRVSRREGGAVLCWAGLGWVDVVVCTRARRGGKMGH
jgi:hypothetical protein